MFVNELVRGEVVTIPRESTLQEAARLMIQCSVGVLVIADAPDARPRGVLTDRDIVAAIAHGIDPERAPVHAIGCGGPVRTIQDTDEIWDVTATMNRYGVRRLPVVDASGRLVGIISLDDILCVVGQQVSDLAGAISAGRDREHHALVSPPRSD